MPKQELLPPQSTALARREMPSSNVPVAYTGGFITSKLATFRANYTGKVVEARARVLAAQETFVNNQTAVANARIKNNEALFLLEELPERLHHERSVRRVQRADTFRAVQHVYEVNELRRQKEYTNEEADVLQAKAHRTHAQTVLVDAEQQFRAQKEHGYLNYELQHKKKSLELLDVELSVAERRAILRQHIAELEAPAGVGNDDLIDDALYAKRAELNASGLDTSKIDAVIESRKARGD